MEGFERWLKRIGLGGGLVLLAAKILSLALMPVSFALGRVLLDGPTSGLFSAMINAPVLALFGFEYYAVTGGLVLVIPALIFIFAVRKYLFSMWGIANR